MKSTNPRQLTGSHSGGFSLIELMVSITIGLILMIAIISAYLGTSSAAKMADAQGRMNEDAQAALSIMAQHIRMAGNNPIQLNYAQNAPRNPAFDATQPFVVRGCDATFTAISTQQDVGTLVCPSTAGVSDAFLVRYEADVYNTVRSSGTPTDCLGNAIPASSASVMKWDGTTTVMAGVPPTSRPVLAAATVSYFVADNRFFVASLNGIPNLYCKGNIPASGTNPAAQPLVENIEKMVVTYGTAAATGTDMSVRGYLTAADVDALATSPPDATTRWSRVVAVRVCVIARSESQVAPDSDSAAYFDCSDSTTPVAVTDRYMRRAYTTTVVIRNRLPS